MVRVRNNMRRRMRLIHENDRRSTGSGVATFFDDRQCSCFFKCVASFLWLSGIFGCLIIIDIGFSGLSSPDSSINRDLQYSIATTNEGTATPNNAVKMKQKRNKKYPAACYRMKDHKDIHDCYPSEYVKHFDDPACSAIQDWQSVDRCLNGRFRYKKYGQIEPIREIHIVGERNTGTKFLTQSLQQCFPKSNGVRVHRDFLRGKHFFQPIVKGDFRSSLVVAVVRDPVEWVAAMIEKPYHSPSHLTRFDNITKAIVPLAWEEFVARPWTSGHGNGQHSMRHRKNKQVCREEFSWKHVEPCRLDNVTAQSPPWNIPLEKWRGFEPIYEQSKTGEPYSNILELRRDKIINWVLQMPLILQIGGFLVVRYEDLLRDGTEPMLQRVADILASPPNTSGILPSTCAPLPPQPERFGKRHIANDLRAWVKANMNVESERLLGYNTGGYSMSQGSKHD